MSEQDLSLPNPTYEQAVAVLERLAANVSPVAPPVVQNAEKPSLAAEVPKEPRPFRATPWTEKTHRELLETLPDALVVIDSDGVMVLVNQQTERLFGYQREELLGQPVELLVPERLRGEHVEHRRLYFANPHPRAMGVTLKLFGRRKDGSLFPVEISLSPLPTEEGLLATSVIRDVSQRERAEAKFRTLVENIPAVTFIAPLDESVPELYVSPQIEHLLGFTQKEWIEDPVLWYRQLHPDDRDRWNRHFAPTCSSGEPFRATYRFIAKDGSVVWVHGSARVVRDAEGKLLFLQGVAFDITSIKEAEENRARAEEALRQVNAELERLVADRTKELEEKAVELRHFAYRASHDLKSPLSSLVSWPEKLAKNYGGKIDPQFDEWLNKTLNGVKRFRVLFEAIKVYSKYLENDREPQPTETMPIAEEACLNLQAAIEESDGQVSLGALPTIMGTPQLILLFQNLLGNAIKYRDYDRPLRIEIDARPLDEEWLFWVRDNGIGIESKYLERIFQLGERLHAASSKYHGTGYGLAICFQIVKRHGGRIWAESDFGQGSTFFFTLPACTEAGALRSSTSTAPEAAR